MTENEAVQDIEKYFKQENSDHDDNPLTSFSPPLSPSTLARLMGTRIEYSLDRRLHSAHTRTQYLIAFMRYYVPQRHQWEFAHRLWSLMMEGYRPKNPLCKGKTTGFYDLCDAIVNGTPPKTNRDWTQNGSWCAAVIGTPGTGKTSTVKAIFSLLGKKIFRHVKHGNLYQQLAVFVTITGAVGNRSLAAGIYEELRSAALATGHYVPQLSSRSTEADYRMAIKTFINKLNLGVLVLDEIQHLYHGTGKLDEAAMRFLTSLINEIQTPVLLIGTWQALPLLSLEARFARRGFSPVNALFRRMSPGKDWNNFVRGLFRYQYVRDVVAPDEFFEEMYKHTQGVHDIAVKFFVLCQLEAIADGSEKITPSLMQEVAARHMSLLAPWIGLMRDGRSEEDTKIYDAEPKDIERYIERFAATSVIRRKRSKFDEQSTPSDLTYSTLLLAEALVSVGLANDTESAMAVAADAVNQSPTRTVAEHVTAAIEATCPKGPQRTRSIKPERKAKELAAFNALNNDDFRKISYLAVFERREVEAAFREAGHLCDITADLEF